jgi:NAD(P)H-dependent nitrite reductase small subunit
MTVLDIRTAWVDVCDVADLIPERGVCALVDGVQVAIFLTGDGELHALSNYDPCSGAYVLSRGILGCRGGVPTVASPMYKQAFDLRTGECLDEPETPDGSAARLRVWPVRVIA